MPEEISGEPLRVLQTVNGGGDFLPLVSEVLPPFNYPTVMGDQGKEKTYRVYTLSFLFDVTVRVYSRCVGVGGISPDTVPSDTSLSV